MNFTASNIAALIVAISFAAGLNIYATLATLGVLARVHWVQLPPGLDPIASPWTIGIALLLFAVEFFADKIPAFDLVWNTAHTFIRIPLAALLAWKSASQLSPELQALAAIAGALISAAAHSSKTAARVLATASPEPVSNIALSASEDVAAVGLTWVATRHPYAAAIVAGGLLLVIVLSARWVLRRMRLAWQRRPQWLRTPSADQV